MLPNCTALLLQSDAHPSTRCPLRHLRGSPRASLGPQAPGAFHIVSLPEVGMRWGLDEHVIVHDWESWNVTL